MTLFALTGALLLVVLPTPSVWAQDGASPSPAAATLGLEVITFGLRQSGAFFGPTRTWAETAVRADAGVRRAWFGADVSLLALKTSGRDAYGSGTATGNHPVGSPPATPTRLYLDKAALRFEPKDQWRVTLGRQHIVVGSQFLIGDGVYDGFSRGTEQAVFQNIRKGFDAARVERTHGSWQVDAFAFRVHPTWDAGGGRDGLFGGIDVTRRVGTATSWSAGAFYRHSRSNLDNDMAVLNARGERRSAAGLRVSGEIVVETAGACRNVVYCNEPGSPLNEYAWHAEAGFDATRLPLKPHAELGYVLYSDDFTPVATGFSDWGRWYLGNQIDWIIFGTNTRVWRAEAGVRPHSTIRLRAQYHNTRLVSGVGGSLSNEAVAIAEWYPVPPVWLNVLVGHSAPGRALAAAGLANPFAALNSGAAPVGQRRSLDLVVAVGVRVHR